MTKQDYETPPEFMVALEKRFGCKVDFDLAANKQNAKAKNFFEDGVRDALLEDWTLPPVKLAWLNPPFKRIDPWAAKLLECRHLPRFTVMLVPASIGSLWYPRNVQHHLYVEGVTRMTFVGETQPYPKDLMLCIAGYGMQGHGFWDWKRPR